MNPGISSVENLSGGGGVLDPLPARPQPARSPYEWMKRPGSASRPSKEGSPDGKYIIYNTNIFNNNGYTIHGYCDRGIFVDNLGY